MGEAQPIGERLLGIIPENPFAALVEGDMLAVIFFALLLGVGLLMAREAGQAAGRQAGVIVYKLGPQERELKWHEDLLDPCLVPLS